VAVDPPSDWVQQSSERVPSKGSSQAGTVSTSWPLRIVSLTSSPRDRQKDANHGLQADTRCARAHEAGRCEPLDGKGYKALIEPSTRHTSRPLECRPDRGGAGRSFLPKPQDMAATRLSRLSTKTVVLVDGGVGVLGSRG